MGISNDYGIAPAPLTEDPDPQGENAAFLAYKEAGVDSFQFHIRGGSHEESALIPGMTVPVLGLATLRGSDLVAWYSTAWFDKHVKCAGDSACEQDADRRLLTDRWRDDLRSGQIDTNDDPNVFSFYRRSRYDFLTADGAEVVCDDMRAGCASMGPDGLPPGYDLVADAYTPAGGRRPAAAAARRRARCRLTGQRRQRHAADARPERGRGRDPRRRAATTACVGWAATTASTATRARTGSAATADRRQALRRPRRATSLRGGTGRDRIRGGPGDDVVVARDRGRDRVRCGPGRDVVHARPPRPPQRLRDRPPDPRTARGRR